MRLIRLLLIASALLGSGHALAQELSPPDVTFFGQVGASRTDFEPLGLDEKTDGIRLAAGMWLNDVNLGSWRFGVEGAYNRLGDTALTTRSTREPTTQEQSQFGSIDFVEERSRTSIDISGLQMGVRLYDDRFFHVRAGGYLYSYRERTRRSRLFTFIDTSTQLAESTPRSDSVSSLGPYLGLGLSIPLGKQLFLETNFTVYEIESEQLNSVGLSLRWQGDDN
jgi:hypothetical protein